MFSEGFSLSQLLMARPQLRKTYTWDKPEEIIDLNSFWFQIRRNRHVPCHLPAKDNRKPCTKCRGQPSGGCDWAVGVTEELRPARRGAPWPLVIVSFVDVCCFRACSCVSFPSINANLRATAAGNLELQWVQTQCQRDSLSSEPSCGPGRW